MSIAVKICGITRVEDALAAANAGANAIGLICFRDSSRYVTLDRAQEIISALPPFVSVVGVFVNPVITEVEKILNTLALDILQFHGEETPQFCEQFSYSYIKAIRVSAEVDLVQYAERYLNAKGLLLDSFVEGLHGGSGVRFDWNLIPKEPPKPVILSGGLNPSNVKQAVAQVRPWAVDVSSGVEVQKGIKDAAKITQFIREARYEND